MRNLLKSLSVAALLAATAGAASAQGINFSVGVADDRPSRIERRLERDGADVRVERRRDRDIDVVERRRVIVDDEPVVRRRIVRPAPTRVVCRTEIRRTVRANGVVVTRPREVCRTRAVSASRVIFR